MPIKFANKPKTWSRIQWCQLLGEALKETPPPDEPQMGQGMKVPLESLEQPHNYSFKIALLTDKKNEEHQWEINWDQVTPGKDEHK